MDGLFLEKKEEDLQENKMFVPFYFWVWSYIKKLCTEEVPLSVYKLGLVKGYVEIHTGW